MIKRKPIFLLEFYQKDINTINDLIDDDRGFFPHGVGLRKSMS